MKFVALKGRWALAAACVCVLTSAGHTQSLLRTVNGPALNALYGRACIVLSDQNGDGYKDLLVGAPGFNQQRGAVYCLSGAYLATGTGTQTLWSVVPTANPGDQFGYALADLGDMTGDGASDFLVGQPGYDLANQNDVGAVRFINGSTHAVASLINETATGCAFGSAIAGCGDVDGDGRSEVAVGAPGPLATFSTVWVLLGAHLHQSQSAQSAQFSHRFVSGPGFGTSIASGFDLNGDGRQEIAVGYPDWDEPGAGNCGRVVLLSTSIASLFVVNGYTPSIPGERFGQSLDAAHDYDGDGVVDLVVGAPNALDASAGEAGRVALVSGARLWAQTLPYEFRTLPLGFGTNGFGYHFGAAVRASADLNGDGVGEILVGAPDYFTIGGGGTLQSKGLVSVYSGSTATRWNLIAGSNTDLLGDGLAGAVDDLDGDGLNEFVVAGSRSDSGGADSGVLKCYRLNPVPPASYCTGKVNSLGCTPQIDSSGSPSASSGAPFLVSASNVVNQKVGLLIYSHQPSAVVFQGGTKCVGIPTRRTPPQSSGGSTSGADCSGTFGFDFNGWIGNGSDPSLVAGAELFTQYWSRDPQSPSHTSLSNALRFLINP
ncbi:MAG: FG-GAP repeat protein [Planctomycetes bacterium]|nr:FG-GAP repeat protein [Planctomycetota bacterium]